MTISSAVENNRVGSRPMDAYGLTNAQVHGVRTDGLLRCDSFTVGQEDVSAHGRASEYLVCHVTHESTVLGSCKQLKILVAHHHGDLRTYFERNRTSPDKFYAIVAHRAVFVDAGAGTDHTFEKIGMPNELSHETM